MVCSRCKAEKEAEDFGVDRRRRNGLRGYCRDCARAFNQEFYSKNKDQQKQRAKDYRANHPEKPKEWADRVPKEVKAARFKSWRERNLESSKARRRKHHHDNREANLLAIKDWKRRNPEKNAFYVMKRQAAKLRAIPSWVDMQKVEEIYTEARRLTELTGIKHHVDHIVPLQSPWVCGLHCEANLQILPYYENQSKSNRVWPDMPDLTGCSPLEIAV